MAKRRIGILTGGGDCPGLNAVIRGVAKAAMGKLGLEVIGFHDGFEGLVEERFTILRPEEVSGILTLGGTILGSSNTANPFQWFIGEGENRHAVDKSDTCVELYEDLGLEALICVGGDGTMSVAGGLAQKGIHVIGVPKTIDNDLMGSDITFGFDSARTTATEAIDKLHTTAQSHHRVLLVEVMGRNAGWLALESGIAGGGDVILIPELPYKIEKVISDVRKRSRFGKRFSIVVVSEGARPEGGEQVYQRIIEESPEPVRLGGVSHVIARQIEDEAGTECRVAVLGHLQRGGTPTPFDRLLATRFAIKAMDLFAQKRFNEVVVMQKNELTSVPVQEVMNRQRLVPPDSELIKVALAVGTSFGVEMD